ncbi:MAG TPA: DUF222 domain-containing protein, partial [Segeticoccus sp.]|uniref:HNH endonuclease n=1 Tax=Segeticoccus sp. TaxID=2706531 RepID=UPI002D7F9641
ELLALLKRLPAMDSEVGNAERIDQIAALERLKAACAAQQARVTAALHDSRTEWDATFGVRKERQGSGVGSEVALARRDSPQRGNQHVGFARALAKEMPCTLAALSAGTINEFKATILVKATATLSVEDRRRVDAELADRMGDLGHAALEAAARAWAQKLDPEALVRRTRGAAKDRCVTVRPAPDTMTYLTGFLPVKQGIAAHVALSRHADQLKAAGDERSRGQIMADTMFERLTGAAKADDVGVEVQLVMTDRTLLAGGDEPGRVAGYGPVPADVARELLGEKSRAWLRRLYTAPDGSALVQMDSRRRLFDSGLRQFLLARDQTCRTPWCDSPIRHADHVVAHAKGGPTSAANGQGLCALGNLVKEQPGWSATVVAETPHTVEVVTPTGHRYTSTAPPPLEGADPPQTHGGADRRRPVVDRSWLARYVAAGLEAA